jgi:hypothetical protein
MLMTNYKRHPDGVVTAECAGCRRRLRICPTCNSVLAPPALRGQPLPDGFCLHTWGPPGYEHGEVAPDCATRSATER